MRIIVDLPSKQIHELDRLSRLRKVSRAEFIRQAVADYLNLETLSPDDAFDAWRPEGADGVMLQRKLRMEWDR